jgi:hypothetical protein
MRTRPSEVSVSTRAMDAFTGVLSAQLVPKNIPGAM